MLTSRAEATASGVQSRGSATRIADRLQLLTVEVGDETVSRNLLLKFLAINRRTA